MSTDLELDHSEITGADIATVTPTERHPATFSGQPRPIRLLVQIPDCDVDGPVVGPPST
jgi:hypothetical protein